MSHLHCDPRFPLYEFSDSASGTVPTPKAQIAAALVATAAVDGVAMSPSAQRGVVFGTGIPRVGFSHTVPEPAHTIPVPGTGTYRTVNLTVSYGTRGTIGTRGFLV